MNPEKDKMRSTEQEKAADGSSVGVDMRESVLARTFQLPTDKHRAQVKGAHICASEAVKQDATGMSVSVGNDGRGQPIKDGRGQQTVGGAPGITSVGGMIWEGLDGESVSPRHFHRKRSDLTSRGQVRMGYGMRNKQSALAAAATAAPEAPPRMLGQKTLHAKRAAQKKYADDIMAATALRRPQTPQEMPTHSAMPMNRPKENNWAFQTIFLPQQRSHWNPGNVSKVTRNIDYVRERPTFGPHFSSN